MTDEEKKEMFDRVTEKGVIAVVKIFNDIGIDYTKLPEPTRTAAIKIFQAGAVTVLEEVVENENNYS